MDTRVADDANLRLKYKLFIIARTATRAQVGRSIPRARAHTFIQRPSRRPQHRSSHTPCQHTQRSDVRKATQKTRAYFFFMMPKLITTTATTASGMNLRWHGRQNMCSE